MSLLRKVLVRGASPIMRTNFAPAARFAVAQRNMSTILDQREHAEESRYIRAIEAKSKAEMKEKLQKILDLEDGHKDKEELVALLGEKKDEPKNLISRLGLNDWKFALPAGLLVAIPALSNEVLILDAETQLVACFILFCSTMYTQVGGMMSKGLDNYSKEIHDQLKEVDNQVRNQIETAIEIDKEIMNTEADFKEYCDLNDNLAVAHAEMLNAREAHLYRESIMKKLDSLSALEDSAVLAIRNRMMNKVKTDVLDTFKNDRKAKDAALNRAVDFLAGGAKGNLGKDIVGEVFIQAVHAYKDNYAKQPAGSDPILVQLEKDMAAVAAAPVIESKGGNVFVTHPLTL